MFPYCKFSRASFWRCRFPGLKPSEFGWVSMGCKPAVIVSNRTPDISEVGSSGGERCTQGPGWRGPRLGVGWPRENGGVDQRSAMREVDGRGSLGS